MKLADVPADQREALDGKCRRFKEKKLEGKSVVTIPEIEAIRDEFLKLNNLEP